MAKYKVLTPVDIDNKRLEPGKTVELDDDTAQPLMNVRAVEAVPAPAKGKTADADTNVKP